MRALRWLLTAVFPFFCWAKRSKGWISCLVVDYVELCLMETAHIYSLTILSPSLQRRLYAAQQESARVWTVCRDRHLAARRQHTRWPDRDDLQQATKGQFALYSQTVQMICHQFLANVDATRELRQTNRKIRYPYKDKRFFPLY
jgi:putative transposase